MQTSLTEKQSAFVRAYIDTGSARAASRIAGYAEGSAAEIMRRPAVEEAIVVESLRRFAQGVPVALSVMTALMVSADSEKVRLDAAKAFLERALGGPVQRTVTLRAEIDLDEGDVLARIGELARELGLQGDRRTAAMIDVTPEDALSAPSTVGASAPKGVPELAPALSAPSAASAPEPIDAPEPHGRAQSAQGKTEMLFEPTGEAHCAQPRNQGEDR